MSTETSFGMSPDAMNQGGITKHSPLEVLYAESVEATQGFDPTKDTDVDKDEIPSELLEKSPTNPATVEESELTLDSLRHAQSYREGVRIYAQLLRKTSLLSERIRTNELRNLDQAMLDLRNRSPKATRHM